ncbi:MAG: tetratricopeptide repeat protein [Candidatus Obscuribacterales bacterium]|nr:tetratricopeptide repeat protein [Candidatus Obscuribacterales bacterium]
MNSDQILTLAFLLLALTSLGYLIPITLAHPSPQLVIALAVELLWFGAWLAFKIYRLTSVSGRAHKAVIETLVETAVPENSLFSSFMKTRSIFRNCLKFALAGIWSLMLLDLSGFLLAYFGFNQLSSKIYTSAPVSTLLGLNAGFSLEVLGGAYIESKNWPAALKIFKEIESIRMAHYGPISEKIVALGVDYGDLYCKMNDLDKAEASYKNAVKLGDQTLGDRGTGRGYTRLANLLTARGKLQEASLNYEKALHMREEQFGKDSAKVAETLFAYSVLLDRIGDHAKAKDVQERADKIYHRLKSDSKTQPSSKGDFSYAALYGLGGSLLLGWLLFGRRGFLTGVAIKMLQNKLNRLGENPRDRNTLDLLKKYAGKNKKD